MSFSRPGSRQLYKLIQLVINAAFVLAQSIHAIPFELPLFKEVFNLLAGKNCTVLIRKYVYYTHYQTLPKSSLIHGFDLITAPLSLCFV